MTTRAAKRTQETKLRVPPQNLEAEQSVLGGLLVDADAINKVADIVAPDDFYRESHGRIFEIILDLYDRNEPIDLITVSSLAKDKGLIEKIGGITYINTLVDLMPSAANIAQYARLVREKALLRNLMNVATEIIEKGHEADLSVDTYLDEAEKMIFQVSENKLKPSFFSVRDIVKENVKTIERLSQNKQSVIGVPTGYVDLDKLTSGLQPSDLIVVAGRPEYGQNGFLHEHSPVRGLPRRVGAGGDFLPRNVEGAARHKASQLRIGSGAGKAQDRRALGGRLAAPCPGCRQALRRRHIYRRLPRNQCPGAPGPGEEAQKRTRPGSHHYRLSPAHAGQERNREKGAGNLGDLPLAERSRKGAQHPGHRHIPAQPDGRAARRQEAPPLGSPGIGRNRAGCGCYHIHLSR